MEREERGLDPKKREKESLGEIFSTFDDDGKNRHSFRHEMWS